MNKTPICWVKNPDGTQGYTWNPITGCLNGCDYCYARKLANTRLRERYLANHNMLPFENIEDEDGSDHWQFHDPFYPRLWEDRLKELEDRHTRNNRFSKPIGVFVCDMSDLFGIGVPEEWTRRVLDVIAKQMVYPALDDRFYLLTKQPQNLIKFSPFPDNCFVGVSATDYRTATDACGWLDNVQAKIKFVSLEPLLAWSSEYLNTSAAKNWFTGLDWLIIGACTGTWREIVAVSAKCPALTAVPWQRKWILQPKIEWVEEIVKAAVLAGAPVFLKDNLYPLFNVNTQTDASNLHINYSWAFKETRFKGENDKVEYQGRVILLRQEMPK